MAIEHIKNCEVLHDDFGHTLISGICKTTGEKYVVTVKTEDFYRWLFDGTRISGLSATDALFLNKGRLI